MVIKVGINGFGRIGRVIFRTCLQNSDIEMNVDREIRVYERRGMLSWNKNQLVKVFREKLPPSVPWHTAGVQYVIEASGMFTSLEKASGHLACDGVKRVIVTAPSIDVPMIIIGVNDHKISTAPIVKVLEEKYGVTEGFITSIHAMTPSLKPLDGLCLRGKHWRDHRSIHQNIIPASTGACKALGKIIPQVKDKLTGLAFRVPIVNVSVLDLTVKLESDTNLADIIKAVEEASQSYLQNIIKVSNEEAVSSDFSGDSHSCILDADSSLQLKPNFFKIICWYENEYSYACRVLDSIFFSEKQLLKPSKLPCKTTFIRAKVKKQDDVQETERNKIQCNVAVTGAHKISGSSSQETTIKRKPITRLAMLRKPLTLHNSEGVSTAANCNRGTKKRNELFKIWDDNNDAQKTAVRSNRSSLFHSCMAFAPKNTETENCLNAQERLENVKKEFCKMANITEDLLKKSYINKMQPGNTDKTTLKEAKTDGDVGKHSKIDDNKTFVPPISNEIFKVCGDFKKRVMKRHAVDCSKEEINCSSPGDRNKNISDYYMTGEVKKSVCNKSMRLAPSQDETVTKKTSTNNLSQFINSPNTANDLIHNANKCSKDDKPFSFQNQIANTTINLFEKYDDTNSPSDNIAGLSDSISEVPDVDSATESITLKDAIEEKEVPVRATEDDDEHLEKDTCSTHSSTTIANKSDIADKENYTDFCKYLHNKNYNMLVIDEELKKRNIIILENSSRDKDIESEISLRVSSFNNKLIPEPVILIPDETSGYCSPGETLTSVSIGNRKRHKPDLYDKLDSASGTDSNNSFEINERKSQVIHITDLTNSLDDLARLDKICRIIEISDELSDKLFSSLEQSNLIEHKKWSFRDLCERIQLDDFCNKVFGKTSS
ncbi:hypothetical protein HF086_002922 [Spodoptera exigua]|uniref:Glyceraldehyde 3-phosphate dehydrogenase NAD(P) binding domain-containing protein n=1 Tax=Spodoptera exigua TaxID=7107 RepID=A0A922MC36_SPOEX|nr:hypothetical protein HF086_002922 [Spodoptera exigua]